MTDTDEILLRLALYVARQIRREPYRHVPALLAEVARRRARHGDSPAYRALDTAARAGVEQLAALLLERSERGILVRAVAPMAVVLPQLRRREIIHAYRSEAASKTMQSAPGDAARDTLE
jgi:N-acetylglucosamine kinase-like BadF-type ATPase